MINLKTALFLCLFGWGLPLSAQTTFSFSNKAISCGEQTCLQVTVQDFNNILVFQYSINWDATVLGNAKVQSFDLDGLSEANFNLSTPGIARVGWDDPNTIGISLPNDEVIYEICFDHIGTNSTSTEVEFAGSPIPVEVINGEGTIINTVFESGEIIISCDDTTPVDTGNTSLPLGFILEKDTVNCGNQVCLDVKVQGFDNISFFRYSVAWNPSLLGRETINEINLDGLRFGPVAPGSFWTEWRSPNGAGQTLADNETIYQICFDIPEDFERSIPINFMNVPLPIIVTNGAGATVNPNLENGNIFITCIPEVIDTVVKDVADSLSFALTSGEVDCGEQVCLPITVQDFNDIFSFQYSITYDAAVLGQASVQNFGLSDLNIDNFNVATPGIIRVGWDDSSLEGVTLSDDEVLYELCFNTASNASGDFDIAFSGSPLPIEAVDVDGTIRVPSFSDGNIKIACDSTTNPVDTTISSAFNLALSGGVVECGEQICMDVRVEAFTNIIAFQYSMNWDPAVLGNASVQNFGIADISASNFNIEGPGILRAGWTEPNVEGMTLEAGTVLYQICFDAIGNTATNTPVQFTATPLAIEVMDGAGNIIETQFQEGNVSIECDMPVDTSGNENTDLTFSLSETTGDCADQVCMDVRVQNFKDILSFQYSINWDANLFGTASVQSFGMPDLGTSNFNTSTPGILRVGWDDVFITGVSLPDDHLIYQVCFDNISDSVKNAPINFSGTPTSVEVVNAQSNIVAPAFENGSLTITCNTDNGNGNGNGGNMGQSDLTFTLSEMTATCEEEVCMDVRVKGFRNILSLQYTINWDADLLGSANAQSFGLPDMGLANFNNNTPGILRIGWDDTFITGVSVPDDHVIFQLCFTDRQDSINATPVRFTDTPTSIEVVNRREELLIPIFEDGTVTVDCKSTALVDNDNDGFTNDVDCDDNNPIIYPGAHEFPNNAVDEDCDGVALFIDADNDGFNSSIDCDDNDPNINGNATEIPNNGIDEDCDGADLVTGPVDADNDGFNSDVDCDDNNPEINPSATEIANNGIDEDCDGADLVTGMVDNDNDGFNSDVDCDDNNPNINPSAAEIPNNEVDENCDGVALQIDADNDGFNSDIDCDDNNPNVNPSAAEVPNNAVDENCDGVALQIDADNDGFNSDVDCDDNNPNVNPSAAEIPNNEVDENCDGVALQIDADNDGFNSDVDCDDNNPEINPSATEIANNGIDEDCDGMDLMEGSPDDFGMILSSATASCGEQVCLKASVRNFKDIISFQYSINWDTTVLKYTGTQAYNLRGLNENAFFTPQNGVIRVSWFDVTVLGISAEDDAVIFEICFDVISNTSAMTNVEFSNNPIPIEVVDNQSGELAVSLTGGQVNVINCSGVIIGEVELPTMDTNNNFPLIHFQNGAKISLKENTTSPAVKAASFEVYPNPTQNILQIKRTTPFSEDATLRIYSTSGQLLKTKVVGKGTVQASVDLTDFSAGLYLIEIQEGNRFVRERVVKAR